MKSFLLLKKYTLIFLSLVVIFSCTQAPTVHDFPSTAVARDEVMNFENEINESRDNQLNVLSPENFEKSQDLLKDSKVSLENPNREKATLHLVAEGRSYLTRAKEFAETSHRDFEEVIKARELAIQAGAPRFLAKDFESADDRFKKVTKKIESNDSGKISKKSSELQLVYLDLELRSIKHAGLDQARATISQAEKEGAKKFAPRSLLQAEKSVLELNSFITANRHATNEIATRSQETNKVAEHLLKITRDAKNGKKTSSEDMALLMEKEEIKLNDKQSELNQTENQLSNKKSQLAREGNNNIILANKNAILVADQSFNERFEEARKQFTSAEAEVYKQGDKLVIRLRGLEFPSSQYTLKSSNFPLLTKVQNVIKSFGKSAVVIEGHTDSMGGKTANEKLSTNRAEVVKDYLVANQLEGQSALEINSVGYDYQKPLATNKTSLGRAKNRRVDVVIMAEK